MVFESPVKERDTSRNVPGASEPAPGKPPTQPDYRWPQSLPQTHPRPLGRSVQSAGGAEREAVLLRERVST